GAATLRLLRKLLIAQHDFGASDVLLQVADAARAGDGQNHGASLEHPGECDLPGRCALCLYQAVDNSARLSEIAGGEREPGDEANPFGFTVVENVFVGPINQVVAVLHGRHREELARGLDLLDRNLAEPCVTDE